MSMVKVQYVGTKQLKRDTITHSLALWVGHGSVCEVPESVAVQLFLFPDVWRPVERLDLARPTSAPQLQREVADDDEEIEEVAAPAADEPAEEVQLHANDEFGFEAAPDPNGPVTVDEIVEMLPRLDRESEFSEYGRPLIGKVRERFPGREVTAATARAAWDKFSGA